ncbi:MAG: hypothetical protein FJW30_12935 [Acidobacteria bacterium]|nr:hypothetical protein [Acidobacteriota bacterium]
MTAVHMLVIINFQAAASEPCAGCHAQQAAMHAATNHARTLRKATTTEFARAIPDTGIAEARNGFTIHYRAAGEALRVQADKAEGVIEWVIGAGEQGLTPLVSRNGEWLEHRFSFYTKPGRFDLTLGHSPGRSRNGQAALGIVQPPRTINACFSCHSTHTNTKVEEPGVTCQRCHPADGKHFARPVKNQVERCAECHRLEGPNDKLAIRFQPLRLVKSQCYSKGQIQCGHCHEPHTNAVRNNPDYYRAKCAECHASAHAREAQDCLPCHMPKSSPAPYLEFTDHRIR